MSSPRSFPIIRLELEGMKHTIAMAFSEYTAQMDADVRYAVEQYCQPDHLRMVIKEICDKHLRQAIEREIERFFRYGAGKDAIARAVIQHLDETEQYWKEEHD